jgi:SpoVK/Ycf46/Vps4 family AAA+-type ATPase
MTLDTSVPETDSGTEIPGVAEFMSRQGWTTRETFAALAQLFSNRADEDTQADKEISADRFVADYFGVRSSARLVSESRSLNPVSRIAVGLAVATLIDRHDPSIGPGYLSNPPGWETVELTPEESIEIPCKLSASFPAGTLHPDTAVVVQMVSRESVMTNAEITVYTPAEGRGAAKTVLADILALADRLNPLRGRACRATGVHGLSMEIISLPDVSRENIIVPEQVWDELDLNVKLVGKQNASGWWYGRRGVMLVGPPGVGKTVLCTCVAKELVGAFTCIFVDGKTGASQLTDIMVEASRLQPCLVVLNDLDLWVRDRRMGSPGLAELLQALDTDPAARILVLATTNDHAGLDKAAIRNGRIDSIIPLDYPSRAAATRILDSLIPGGVDTSKVAGAMPDSTSGADIREIVRRAVITSRVSTAGLLEVVRDGRWRPQLPQGQGHYL